MTVVVSGTRGQSFLDCFKVPLQCTVTLSRARVMLGYVAVEPLSPSLLPPSSTLYHRAVCWVWSERMQLKKTANSETFTFMTLPWQRQQQADKYVHFDVSLKQLLQQSYHSRALLKKLLMFNEASLIHDMRGRKTYEGQCVDAGKASALTSAQIRPSGGSWRSKPNS